MSTDFDKSKYWRTQREAEAAGIEVGRPITAHSMVVPDAAPIAPTATLNTSEGPKPSGTRVWRPTCDVPPALAERFVVVNCGHVRDASDKAWVVPTGRITLVEIEVKLDTEIDPTDNVAYSDVEVVVVVHYTSASNKHESLVITAQGLVPGAALYHAWTGHDLYWDYDFAPSDSE